ncbi:CotS family spore coat protein [Proteiniborus sp. MB09-C3]|uniref:CotS family spore coat protein n=1 Tax=Proteiniborus sp. MB09-C3 TaxID=3050072 RepID=UPI0025538A8E|nr:CotS family spore coat protein [Proteiniborus sp. MB09-C3]WIV11204.1 CotS family spore coat protein [Proteiniborus sp. MB09-C3]
MGESGRNLQNMILKKYNFKVQDIILERSKGREIWTVATEKGPMILKKFCRLEPRTKFIIAGMEHLRKNGINIPEIYPNVDNRPYTTYKGSCYILMKVINGRPPRYNSMDDLETIVNELGRFHNASKGFIPPAESNIIDLLGKWPNMMINGLRILRCSYKIGKEEEKNTKIGEVILKELPYLIKRTKQLVLALRISEYNSWVEKAKRKGSLCHLDYARYNLRICPDNRVYIFDFDTLAMELPAIDIRKLIYHIYYTNIYDSDTIRKILSWYQQSNPLSKEEWLVARLIFLYPIEAINLFEKYIKMNRKQNMDNIISLIIKSIETEKKLYYDLGNYDDIINKLVM